MKYARRQLFRRKYCCERRAIPAVRFVAIVISVICSNIAVQADIQSARFVYPTARYGHAVLGDDIEYGGLRIRTSNTGGKSFAQNAVYRSTSFDVFLPLDRVFEDLAPRLIDIDGDGLNEIMVVETSVTQGAQLAIYDETGTKIAQTPHLGRRFRWLGPIGAADLDNDGNVEIAYIDRPHSAKRLRVWRYNGESLVEVDTLSGLTNHRIGDDFITSGIRDCGHGAEIVTVNGDWSRILVSRLKDDQLTMRDIGPFNPTTSLKPALECVRGGLE